MCRMGEGPSRGKWRKKEESNAAVIVPWAPEVGGRDSELCMLSASLAGTVSLLVMCF